MFELLFKEPLAVWREADWSFASGWSGAALAVAVAVAALAIVISLWRAPLAPGRKLAVALLQLMVAAVALVMLWRPALELERTRPGENALAWLVDDSASMLTADASSAAAGGVPVTRREAVVAALNGSALRADDRFVDRLVSLGEEPRLLERLDSLEDLPPVSARSGIATALEAQLTDVGATSLAAVVLLSDGADNVGGVDARWWQRLAAAGVPVHTVGVGRTSDASDLELADVELPRSAAAGTVVRARLRIVHGRGEGGGDPRAGTSDRSAEEEAPEGMVDGAPDATPGRSVRLRVTRGEALVFAEDIALDEAADETVRSVDFDAGEAGLQRLDFTLAADPGEANLINNRQARILDVRDAPHRVLYVEGEPRWEYKFLRRALADRAGIEIVSLLRTSPNKFYRQGVRDGQELADGFPRTREALFAYDAIIIGSLPAAELDAGQQAALRDFVNLRGGSLLMLAGRQGLADGGWARSGVAAALPVTLDARLDARSYRRERVRAEPTRQGLRTPWLRFAEAAADDLAVWRSLPAVADHQSLGTPKPGARVLLVRDDGEPLLAAQRYGRGTSFVLGTSGTWRWQMGLPSEDDSHERFWRGLLGELVAHTQPRLAIVADGPVVRDADSTRISVDALAADFTPLVQPSLQAVVTTPAGVIRQVELLADPAQAGRYAADIALDADGAWGVAVTSPPGGESPAAPPISVERWLLRESGTAESFGARQQRGFLERVATSTGGSYRTLEQIDGLSEALAADNAALTRSELLPLWNMPLFFVLLLVGKGGEWLLRLRWKRL